jgi:ssDNA thymidine ADP-ribosyltransferase, DarT
VRLSDEIKVRYQLVPYACHVTHVDNLKRIIESGGLLAKNRLPENSYTDISMAEIQERRGEISVLGTSKTLHDFVPFWFTFKTPMMAKVQDKSPELVYLQLSLDILSKGDVVITDGNAASANTKFRLFRTFDDLQILDLSILQKKVDYAGNPERKRLKSAEILIPDKVPWADIGTLVCFNDDARARVLAVLAQFGMKNAVWVRKDWFFFSQAGKKV